MKKYFAALSATALISVAPYALAASSTDLTVTGSIVPSACTPSLSGNGDIDVGKRSAKDLHPTNHTRLGIYPLQLSVTCDAPMTFALYGKDNRPNTASSAQWYGLGLTPAGEKLGTINVMAKKAVADGNDVHAVESVDGGTSWRRATWLFPARLASVSSTTDHTTRVAVENLVMDLDIYVNIAPARTLTLTDDITIDGSATLEMMYP